MTDRTAPLIDAGVLTRAAATGLAGAALSVERHPRTARGLGLVMSAGLGAWTALAASGVVRVPGAGSTGAGSTSDEATGSAPPVVAAALGVGAFVLTAGASELGLRGQRGIERWADRTTGHPRVVIGALSAALSLAVDVAERAASRG